MVSIVQKENPVLRQEAKTVPIKDITTEPIKKILKQMQKALGEQNDGVEIGRASCRERV